MTIREQLEQLEMDTLSAYGTKSAQSRGRQKAIEPCELRTQFQRDRDRILHCKAFRRLKHKSQVFLSPKGDHFRTRLTHTLEVSQIARTMARALRLNEDLTEAISLGHDLGHTPFGHMGERTLNALVPGGFSHKQQSLRVVDRLEGAGNGLNLTYEVRDGIAHHSGDEQPQTLEGRLVHYADRIAYINHDMDDALRAGIIKQSEIPQKALSALGDTHGKRINTMILDIITQSREKPEIKMSDKVQEMTDVVRQFLFKRVYRADWALQEEKKTDYVLRALFQHYHEHPTQMPIEFMQVAYWDGMDRAVCDHIASMTDNYAVKTFEKIFIPEFLR